MGTDGGYTHLGGHFTMYTNVEKPDCTPETHRILYANKAIIKNRKVYVCLFLHRILLEEDPRSYQHYLSLGGGLRWEVLGTERKFTFHHIPFYASLRLYPVRLHLLMWKLTLC